MESMCECDVNAYSCLLSTATDFTEEEVRKFDRRLEEGFDLPGYDGYDLNAPS